MPITDEAQYAKANDLVTSGKAKDPGRLKTAMASFRAQNPHLFASAGGIDLAQGEGLQGPAGVELAKRKAAIEAKEKAEALARDEALPNASKLKVYADPAEYEPPAKPHNPFSLSGMSLGNPKLTGADRYANQLWSEPSVEEFKGALKDGALAYKLREEFPGAEDPSELLDTEIENSQAFRAYQDAAWRNALSKAIALEKPIYRRAYSKKVSEEERGKSELYDKGAAATSGFLQGASMGLVEPAIDSTGELRKKRLQNSKSALGGEIAGSVAGAPRVVTQKLAGMLGSRLPAIATSTLAGAGAGAVDVTSRQVGQSAAEALDAKDTAVEGLSRVYGALNPAEIGQGALLGGAVSAGGDLLGAGAKLAAKKIMTSGNRGPVLLSNLETGGKMSPGGDIVLEPDLEALRVKSAMTGTTADDELAEKVMPEVGRRQLLKQEQNLLTSEAETMQAQEALGGQSVSTQGIVDKVQGLLSEMPGVTDQGAAQKKAISRFAKKLRRQGRLTAKDLDNIEAEIDRNANMEGGKRDPLWNQIAGFAREARDEFNDPTLVDNFAIRSPRGEVKPVSGYSGLNAKQARRQGILEMENRNLGLPGKLKAKPTELGRTSATDDEAGAFIAEQPELSGVVKFLNQDRAVASGLERGNTPTELTPTRVSGAIESASAANKALRKAADEGYVYDGDIYRGSAMSDEQIQRIISSGRVKNDSIWSASKQRDYADEFASKAQRQGKTPVLFEIVNSRGVPMDGIPGSNTFDEVAIPTGESFRVIDSFRDDTGKLVIRLEGGKPSLDDLATAARPEVNLDFDQRQQFKGAVKSYGKQNTDGVRSRVLKEAADDAGVGPELETIRKLRNRQDWRELLGESLSGISAGPHGLGNKFLSTNQLLRIVPTLKSASGGLPKMEASDQMVKLMDKVLAGRGTWDDAGEVMLDKMVPSTPLLSLRGGLPAVPSGAVTHKDKDKGAKLSAEERALAMAVIKYLLKRQEKN